MYNGLVSINICFIILDLFWISNSAGTDESTSLEDILEESEDTDNQQVPATPTKDDKRTAEGSSDQDPTLYTPSKKQKTDHDKPSTSQEVQQGVKRKGAGSTDTQTVKKVLVQQATSIVPVTNVGNSEASNSQPMQIDRPEGNDPNTGGTLQGEAGTRKKQVPRGRYFGLIKVSNIMSDYKKAVSHYLCAFQEKTQASNLMDILEVTWQNIEYCNCYIKEFDHYLVYFALPFNISWKTLAARLGTGLSDAYYITNRKLSVDSRNATDDEVKEGMLRLYRILRKNNILTIDLQEEIEKENTRKNYKSDEPQPKKRRTDW